MLSLNITKFPMIKNQSKRQVSNVTSKSLLSQPLTQKQMGSAINKDGDLFFNSSKIKSWPNRDNFLKDFFNPCDYASFLN